MTPCQIHARRAARWAATVRGAIIAELGGRCAGCGNTDRLEIDHIHGRAYKLESLSRWQRAVELRKEHAAGKLQVLCRRCNAQKG